MVVWWGGGALVFLQPSSIMNAMKTASLATTQAIVYLIKIIRYKCDVYCVNVAIIHANVIGAFALTHAPRTQGNVAPEGASSR